MLTKIFVLLEYLSIQSQVSIQHSKSFILFNSWYSYTKLSYQNLCRTKPSQHDEKCKYVLKINIGTF